MKQELLGQLNGAYEFFERSTRNLSEEDSTFSPADGVYTTAQQVAHAAQTIDWFMNGALDPKGFDMDFEAHDRQVREVTSLADARARLEKSVKNARAILESEADESWLQPLPDGPVMGGAPRATIFGAITDHTAHHRGALTVYARLRGKTPPNPYIE